MKKTITEISKSLLLALVIPALFSCTNMSALKSKSTSTTSNPAFSSSSGFFTHTLQTVNVDMMTGSTTNLALSLATAPGISPLTQYCQVGSSSTSPCVCVLKWTELNTIGGNSVSISRTRKLDVDQVQTSLVRCQMTQSFWDEIPAGTTMQLNIEPISPNVTGLSVQQLGYKKGTSVAPAGDFVDNTLTPFRNIFHYSCFSKRDSAYEIMNSLMQGSVQGSNNQTTNVSILLASSFCASSAASNNCPVARRGYSAQSYYRNLYVRSDRAGQINSTNSRYDCPKVYESINYSATNTPSVPQAEQNKYWPLDSTFAVATTQSSEWSVPIPAASVLTKNGDTYAVDDSNISNRDRLQEFGSGGIAWKMLGYGKRPNPNGTCGSIVDSNGQTRPLTRLRRYRVIYPPAFQDSGQVVQERPEADQIYVADRLVVDTGGNHTGNMIYGPKPCNFSWFDHQGVTNRVPGSPNFQTNILNSVPIYRATNEYVYDQTASAGDEIYVNPDGRMLPNFDRGGTVGNPNGPSCSASIPIYEYTMGVPSKVRLITSYRRRTDWVTLGTRKFYTKEVHLGIVEPWNPEYVEDTSFQACVPISDTYREPPMHFYRENASGGKVAWCTKSYPTQNPYWLDLNTNKKPSTSQISGRAVNWWAGTGAQVDWFTSHIQPAGSLGLNSFNTCSGTPAQSICEWSLGSSSDPDYNGCVNYLNTRLTSSNPSAYQNRCDRTVMFDPYLAYRGFPLQARDTEIRNMLKADLAKMQSYACNYSVHVNPLMVNKMQPMTNCCGSKNGVPILDEATSKLIPDTPANQGHLEPYLDTSYPNVRYCGNPVD